MVLLIIDTQNMIVEEKLYQKEVFIESVRRLIQTARDNQIEVVYVRHDDGPGEDLTKGNEGFEIYEGFKPLETEQIFDKHYNSAFRGTGLLDYLWEKEEQTLMIAGLQTDYCIDASIKAGFEHGFQILVPEGANTTVENRFMSAEKTYRYFNEFVWPRRYAECVTMDEAIQRLEIKHELFR